MYKYRVVTYDDNGVDSVMQCDNIAVAQDYYKFKCNHIKTYRDGGRCIYIIENSTNIPLCSSFFSY